MPRVVPVMNTSIDAEPAGAPDQDRPHVGARPVDLDMEPRGIVGLGVEIDSRGYGAHASQLRRVAVLEARAAAAAVQLDEGEGNPVLQSAGQTVAH